MRNNIMTKEVNVSVPYQVQQIIDNMLNKKDNVHIRFNYRTRLDIIRLEIEKAIRKYDNEIFHADSVKGKKKVKA